MSAMSHKATLSAVLFLLQGLLCSNTPASDNLTEELMGVGAGITWESKYVSEGRDNLDKGGLVSFESGVEKSGFSFGLWYAVGDSVNYEELNISAEYHHDFAGCDLSIGYTRLEFLEDHESDNEISAGLSYTGLSWVTPSLSYVYSTEANGAFVEFEVSSEIDLVPGKVTICPYIREGFDFGYASEEYNGPNNFQLGVEIAVSVREHIQFSGHLAHSWAHKDVKQEGQGNISWAGIGVSVKL